MTNKKLVMDAVIELMKATRYDYQNIRYVGIEFTYQKTKNSLGEERNSVDYRVTIFAKEGHTGQNNSTITNYIFAGIFGDDDTKTFNKNHVKILAMIKNKELSVSDFNNFDVHAS
jgi:hypothetical protein